MMTWQAWLTLYILVGLLTLAFYAALGTAARQMDGDQAPPRAHAERALVALLWPAFWLSFLLNLAAELGDALAQGGDER